MASVLVVEPWYGGSHKVWLDGWRSHSRHELQIATLPDRFWRWRLRAGAVELASTVHDLVASGGRPDLVVVSSLADASVLAGLTRRVLGSTPLAVYMHENQLLYPPAPNRPRDDDASLANWRSLLVGDALWWNSDFHRNAMLSAVPELLARQPEQVVAPSLDDLESRSTVLWPGIRLDHLIDASRTERTRPTVLWNQRWDHDKNPRAVFSALIALANEGVDFDVILAGEDHGHAPDLAELVERLGPRVRTRGFLAASDYERALLSSDVVVSAANHEFFGIAIVEAMAAGAVPVLPDRLSFPELVGEWADACLYPDGGLRNRLRTVLDDPNRSRAKISGLRESMSRFDITRTAEQHDIAVDAVIAAHSG